MWGKFSQDLIFSLEIPSSYLNTNHMKKLIVLLFFVSPIISPAQNPKAARFHRMLPQSSGTWIGEGTMQFSSEGQRINGGTSRLVNKMSSDGFTRYQR